MQPSRRCETAFDEGMSDRLGGQERTRNDAAEQILFAANAQRTGAFIDQRIARHEIQPSRIAARRVVLAAVVVTEEAGEPGSNPGARNAFMASRVIGRPARVLHDRSRIPRLHAGLYRVAAFVMSVARRSR
ncbi:MAG: hypothetical protein A3H27_04185 [Acidobacteria bacterium RIFCSPLOWO2_02_FULL_59_13]|nr:MAG: hypothetical protein A3H27_04185 [Acidobacteria bacterium RIFCSPLOWO2_02_FULL_59_13]